MPTATTEAGAEDLANSVGSALTRLMADRAGLGIALSGGGDSVALLHLAHGWAASRGITLRAATVDHGLRPESRAEAQAAAAAAARLGIAHDILTWHRTDGPGNLMAQARDARLRLLSDWAAAHRLEAVALGHTADDVAETLLMRLGRGAGADGLATMAPSRRVGATVFLRPMLTIGRAELRDWLTAHGIGWIDDPSNDNPRFDRARVRAAMANIGLDPTSLAQVAANMAMIREALDHGARAASAGFTASHGTLRLPRAGFTAAPAELRRRLLIAAVRWVSGHPYPPRRSGTLDALTALEAGRSATLGGVILRPARDMILALREPAAAARAPEPQNGIWDARWRLGRLPAGAQVTALGLRRLGEYDWRAAGLTRFEAASLPCIILPGGRTMVPAINPLPASETPLAAPLRNADDFIAALSH